MPERPQTIGRYELHGEIAAGGMATVHYGRLVGPVGFSRTVAIKRLHPQFAKDPEFVSMFLDEARLAARVRHPNVVATLDVEALDGELFLVMEYIQGESVSRLTAASREAGSSVPVGVAVSVMVGALNGLHAAHEATSERGQPLGIVHRDVSPQNLLVGVDGVTRVLDFGVAKAATRTQTTREGQIKGKLAYMSPEQLQAQRIDRRTDVYAASVVLWEMLAGRRLFSADDPGGLVKAILFGVVESPRAHDADVPEDLAALVLRGLARDAAARPQTAKEMARALEATVTPAGASEVGAWVEATAARALARRLSSVQAIENVSMITDAVSPAHASPPAAPAAVAAREAAPAREVIAAADAATPSTPPPTAPGTEARRPMRAGLAVVIGMAVASTATVLVTRWLDGTEASALPATTTAAPLAAPDAPAPAEVEAAAATAPALAPATAPASASPMPAAASAEARPLPRPPRGPAAARAPQAPARAEPEAARPACNPGYYIDDQGLKVWRPECFPKK